jgi:ribosome biogenesis GTPase
LIVSAGWPAFRKRLVLHNHRQGDAPPLAQGGWLLDTPGMRELQLSKAAEGISEVFDDFILVAQQCRFSNCAHGSEPGCAVRAAIAEGTLPLLRFDRWQKLATEGAVIHPRRAKRPR